MTFAFRARNLGPLREIDWKIPEGVSVVVGPNGVGKSTLLRLPEFARIAMNDDLNTAVTEIFGGTAYLKHHAARIDDEIRFGMSVRSAEWDVTLAVASGSIAPFSAETVTFHGAPALRRLAGSPEVTTADVRKILWGKSLIPSGALHRLAPLETDVLQLFATLDPSDKEKWAQAEDLTKPLRVEEAYLAACVALISQISRTYQTYRYNLAHIAKFGSPQSSELLLEQTGDNVFPLLRNWRDRSEFQPHLEFVLSTMREAFPHLRGLDFEVAGQTVTASIVDARYSGKKTPVSRESTGFLTALLHLCAVASSAPRTLVTIDEIETSLHPRAIKVLIEAFRRWAKQHSLSIVLATQSETVLDQFQDDPAKIFVLEPKMAPGPKSLTEMYSPEWLSQFSVGDLFGHLEYGSGNQE